MLPLFSLPDLDNPFAPTHPHNIDAMSTMPTGASGTSLPISSSKCSSSDSDPTTTTTTEKPKNGEIGIEKEKEKKEEKEGKEEWFLPGQYIDRAVITADICRYLGAGTGIREGENEAEKGYWIMSSRRLTEEQVADLKLDSRRWTAKHACREVYGVGGKGRYTVPTTISVYGEGKYIGVGRGGQSKRRVRDEVEAERAEPAAPKSFGMGVPTGCLKLDMCVVKEWGDGGR